MKINKYDVTILVVSYNSKWESLKRTLYSALNQKNINYEIVISDDGSKNNFFSEIREMFKKHKFNNYKLIESRINEGTCINVYKGLIKSQGEFIKTIGAGDCLFDENTLSEWVKFARRKNTDICFGDAVYFTITNNKSYNIISKRRDPQNIIPYKKEKYSVKEGIYNYILLGDAVLGSNFLTKKNVMIYYIERIIGKIRYAEDMIYRMMIADGKKISYFQHLVVWYEYGTGISTSGESKWDKIISNERNISNDLIKQSNIFNGIQRIKFNFVIDCLSEKKTNWIKYLVYPSLISYKKIKDNIKAKTDDNVDVNLLYYISNEKVKI